jgi:hypothetical protein
LKPINIRTYMAPTINSRKIIHLRISGGGGPSLAYLGNFFQTAAFFWLALALFSFLLTGCAVPLGPGFRLQSRQMTWSEAAPPASRIHVRVSDRLQNVGNRDLTYLDVNLAPAIVAGNSTLIVRVNGQPPASLGAASAGPDAPLRLHFDPPWRAGQTYEIVLEYDCRPDPVRGGVASASPQGLYFAAPRALPSWIIPVGVFASAEVLERDERVEITLPSNFKVLTLGRQQRRRARDGSVLYRLRTSGQEFPAFLIAGPHEEQIVSTQNGSITFWVLEPLDAAPLQSAANRLAASAATFTRLFGPIGEEPPLLHIVETPAGVVPPTTVDPAISAASFPYGVLLDGRAFAQGISNEAVLRAAEGQLVRTWFGWRLPVRPEVETFLGNGLSLFSVALAAGAREGPQALHAEIQRMLAAYDRARSAGELGSLLRSPSEFTPEQRAAVAYRGALFLAALRDSAGPENFERAGRRLQDALAGRGLYLALDDLRSALEGATGNDLADIFRLWLNQPDIPAEFRARYGSASAISSAVARRMP